MGQLSNLPNGLKGANLIIGIHHGDQYRIRTNRSSQLLQLYHSIFIHVQISHLKAFLLQPLAGVEYGVMLNLCGNNMLSLAAIALCSGF